MSRRVVLLGPYPPPYGGVSIYISTLFEILKNRGVELWTFGDEEISGPNIFFMKDKRWELLWLLMRRGSRARISDCTHFLVEYPSLLVPVWVVLKALLRFEWIKIIQDGSLPPRYAKFNPLRKALFRVAVRSVTEFVVLNEALERWLQDEVGVEQNVSVIKNLFPISYSDARIPLPAEIETALASYLRRAKRVCSIGVFIPDYGFGQIADAIEGIRRETGADIGLVLLDGDFARDEKYQAEVLQDRGWITVLKNVARPMVFQILKRSDVFVRGFGLESYGLSRVEAIWCGLPVVAARAGETRGMLVYEFGDQAGLAKQLRFALFKPPTEEIAFWAALYRQESEVNVREIVSKIKSIE